MPEQICHHNNERVGHFREMHYWDVNLFWHECNKSQILVPQPIGYNAS